ncbi:MAG: hypothetical protein R3234_01870 [Thermoanaerobaculia bacterium]|nr:hypothetical protein [Thermoanaerobaculia bacterium]
MDRLKAYGAFLVILLALLAILRLVHVAAGITPSTTTPGPLFVNEIGDVEDLVGFVPWVPSYHPVLLGDEPSTILVERSPVPRVTVTWRGDRFASLEESLGKASREAPSDAEPVPGHPSTVYWSRRNRHFVVAPRADLTILIRSDLGQEDVIRMLSTLHPARTRS